MYPFSLNFMCRKATYPFPMVLNEKLYFLTFDDASPPPHGMGKSYQSYNKRARVLQNLKESQTSTYERVTKVVNEL